MKPYLFRIVLSLGAAVGLASCSEDVRLDGEDREPDKGSDRICFVVSDSSASRGGSEGSRRCGGACLYDSEGADSIYLGLTVSQRATMPPTRAAHLTEAGYAALRMTCLKRTAEDRSYYFSNTMFSKDAAGTWASDPPYWWLDANTHFNFYGYAPAEANGATYIEDTQTWQPKLDYAVPADATQQSDLVYNTLTQEYIASANRTVPLKMAHALANVAFRTGSGMAAGTIGKVTVRNVLGRGTLNLTDGKWTLDPTSATDFSANIGKNSADGLDITTDADGTYFMLLPGCTTEATTVAIDFTKADGETGTYIGPLTDRWEAGKQYMYTITIGPDLDITVVPETQDAHYVICEAAVSAANMQPGQKWMLTASASDGADVTIAAQLNDYQKNGFWTDRIKFQADGTTALEDRGSARGEPSLTAEGSRTVYLFLPENIGEEDRTVTLTLQLDGVDGGKSVKTFVQRCPDWTGSFGWEQDESDNPEATWGFLWERKVTYRKNNWAWNLLIYGPMVENLCRQYNATGYAKVTNTSMFQRTTIAIDYSSLNDLSGRNLSESDGLQNTQELYRFSGGASTGNFEQAIKNLASRGANGVFDVISESGENNMTSAALGSILRKNRYNLIQIEKKDGSDVVVSESPVIDVADIVWYLPARTQFVDAPAETPLSGEYWSSTPDGNETAFTSAGSLGRMETRKIRACRQHP